MTAGTRDISVVALVTGVLLRRRTPALVSTRARLRRLSSPARRARTGQGPIGPRLCGEDPASARTCAFGWCVGLLWESALHYRREVAGQRALGFRRSARARAQVSRGVRTSDGEGRPDMVWQDGTEAGSRGDQRRVAGLPGRNDNELLDLPDAPLPSKIPRPRHASSPVTTTWCSPTPTGDV